MPAITHDARDSAARRPSDDARRRALLDRLPAAAPHPVRRLFGESSGVRAIVLIILLLMALLLVRPVIMSLLSWHRTAGLLSERRVEVRDLRWRNQHLRARLAYYKTDAFVAERARQYGLVKPGETPFVVRELVHPELVGAYARTQLANATQASADPALPARSTSPSHLPSSSRIPTPAPTSH